MIFFAERLIIVRACSILAFHCFDAPCICICFRIRSLHDHAIVAAIVPDLAVFWNLNFLFSIVFSWFFFWHFLFSSLIFRSFDIITFILRLIILWIIVSCCSFRPNTYLQIYFISFIKWTHIKHYIVILYENVTQIPLGLRIWRSRLKNGDVAPISWGTDINSWNEAFCGVDNKVELIIFEIKKLDVNLLVLFLNSWTWTIKIARSGNRATCNFTAVNRFENTHEIFKVTNW